jgi:hypothetical protein
VEGMPGGRPRKFTNAEELYNDGMKYIERTLRKDEPLTWTGVCIALDSTRETMNDYDSGKYDNENNRFSDAIKRLKVHCENYAESRLFANNPTGAIFALKNYGWKDKQEVESINHNLNQDVSNLSEEEIDKELERLKGNV